MMKFIDLQQQYARYKTEVDARMQAVLDHGQYLHGPEITELESRLAEQLKVKHCIADASGTLALSMALRALNIGPGDEVITSPFSFFASVSTILELGAKPIFVDIGAKTYNVDSTLIEAAITPKTKAIMAIDLYGQCADYDAINAIAERHDLAVIEDAAQSMGASYKNRPAGGLATIACTSFFPSKPLGCYGDGGACFTNDDALAERLRLLHNHGMPSRYYHTELGTNGRMDSLQAAVLLAKLDHFQSEIELRQQVAAWYVEALADVDEVQLPYIEEGNISAYAQYTIAVDHRDQFQQALQEQGIPTAVHYPRPIYRQPLINQDLQLPVVEQAAARVLSLPFWPFMEQNEVVQVTDAVKQLITQETLA